MMGRRHALISASLMLAVWLVLAISVSSQVKERPDDISRLAANYLVAAPVIDNEPTYTVGTENVIFWTHVADPDLVAYRIEASLSSSFDSPWLSRIVPGNWDSTTFLGLPLDTMWYRVQAAFTPAADTFWSDWSGSTFSIQDGVAPATSCDVTPSGVWSTEDNFVMSFTVADSAGIDSVWLYRRIGDSGPWTMYDSARHDDAPTELTGGSGFSSSLDLQGDNHYQFFIGGRDDAKVSNWIVGQTVSNGNALRPIPSSPAGCEIKVDTKAPLSLIDESFASDSLHTDTSFSIPWSARDSIPASDFYSGLDTVYLYWFADSGSADTAILIDDDLFNELILATPGGGASVNGDYVFEAPYDSSTYYFYTVTVDIAGNRQVDRVVRKTRVFSNLQATLTLYDPSDPKNDSNFTAQCEVDATLSFNVPAVDSFVLCEDANFGPDCTIVGQQTPGPIETTWTFSDCTDGEKWLYAKVYAGDTSSIASASIILDTQPPVLWSLQLYDLSTGDHNFSDNRLVGVSFIQGPGDDDLQWLILSEDRDFAIADTTFLNTDDDTVFTLSEGFEKKTVFGYLVDQAEHASPPNAGSIMLFEQTHNYPNPFNPDIEPTNLVFTLTADATVAMMVYDLFGNLVYERSVAGASGLNDGVLTWNGRNLRNEPVSSGGYICLLKAGDREISRHKIAVIR